MTIASKLTQLAEIKQDIKQAITDKGASPTDDFTTYAGLIDDISSGDKVTISGSNIPANQRVIIGFTPSGVPYLTSYFTEFAYTGISNGDTTFRTALPNPLPCQISYQTVGEPLIGNYYDTTNWSTSDYIDTEITLDYYSGNWEWICKAYYSPTAANLPLVGASALYYGFTYYENGSWRRSANTTQQISSTNTYWFRVRCVNGTLTGYFIADNKYTAETLPPLSSWAACTVKSYQASYTGNITIGKYANESYPSSSQIYLDSIRIYSINTTNNTKTLIWQMFKPFDTTPISDDTTGYQPSGDWVVQGYVPLDFRDGYLNKFSSSSYIKAKTFKWCLANATDWYMKLHFKTPSSFSSNSNIPIWASSDTATSFACYIHGTNHYINVPIFKNSLTPALSTNTEYWVEAYITNSGTSLTTRISTDGVNYTETTETVSKTGTDSADSVTIGYWGNANFYYTGAIYDVELGYTDTETHTFKLWK